MEGGWRTILADPPWSYQNGSAALAGGVEGEYQTMTLADICALPVREGTVPSQWGRSTPFQHVGRPVGPADPRLGGGDMT